MIKPSTWQQKPGVLTSGAPGPSLVSFLSVVQFLSRLAAHPGCLPLGSPYAGKQHHTLQSGPGSLPISLLISTIACDLFLTQCISTLDLHMFNPCFCWKPTGDTISEQHPDIQQKPSCVTDQGSWTRSIEVGKRPDTSSGGKKALLGLMREQKQVTCSLADSRGWGSRSRI